MTEVSAEGSTVGVLMRRLNSSCSRSIAFVARALPLRAVAAGFFQAVGDGATFEAPFADEGLATRCHRRLGAKEDLTPINTHTQHDKQRKGRRLAVNPNANHRAVQDQARDLFVPQIAHVPRVPVAF